MAANLEGEWKTAVEDFDKILGSTIYVESKIIKEVIKMLTTVSKKIIKLAGDQPCIALMGYLYAAELMRYHDWPIEENMNRIDRFLVRVLHKINREVQLAFNAIYDQVYHVETSPFILSKKIIVVLYTEIKIIFRQIVCNQVSDFHLPIVLDNNSTREIRNDGEEIPTDTKKQKRREGNNNTPAVKNLKQKEELPDLWRLL